MTEQLALFKIRNKAGKFCSVYIFNKTTEKQNHGIGDLSSVKAKLREF